MNFHNARRHVKRIQLLLIPILFLMPLSKVFAYDFPRAKRLLPKIYTKHPNTFYCGCDIKVAKDKSLIPKTKACGYQNREPSQAALAKRGEFTHIIPPYEFGQKLKCWKRGERENCSNNDAHFRQMEGDLHNLVPVISEISSDRLGLKFGMIEGEERPYGQCESELDIANNTFEPPEKVRGDIARVYLYFADQYSLKINKKQKKLFKNWVSADPVDRSECELHEIKAALQGNPNPFVAEACDKADFNQESVSSR